MGYNYNWVLFLNNEFHLSFQKKMSEQLFEKGSEGTGISNFKKLNFQLIVGLQDLEIEEKNGSTYIKIDFVTPGSFSIPIYIFWESTELDDTKNLYKRDVTNIDIDFYWDEHFPIDKILSFMEEIEP